GRREGRARPARRPRALPHGERHQRPRRDHHGHVQPQPEEAHPRGERGAPRRVPAPGEAHRDRHPPRRGRAARGVQGHPPRADRPAVPHRQGEEVTEPTVMRSRQAAGLALVPPSAAALPAAQDAGRLATEITYAQEIAKAGDMLPASHRTKPGAVLLVNQWAQKHDVDILTAMQTVAFVQGRPVIDATMQRALAERAGYRVKVLDDECTDESAKVEVWRDDELIGSASYTIDQAKT